MPGPGGRLGWYGHYVSEGEEWRGSDQAAQGIQEALRWVTGTESPLDRVSGAGDLAVGHQPPRWGAYRPVLGSPRDLVGGSNWMLAKL